MKPTLITVQYHGKKPKGMHPKIMEIAGHFDKKEIKPTKNYSLHTEYAFGKRKLDNPLIDDLDEIKNANRNGIPLLWHSKEWSSEFHHFITRLVDGLHPPTVIEIHPPFKDYCPTTKKFLNRYKKFEKQILNNYPNTTIAIENRSGTHYKKSQFLLSKSNEIKELLDEIKKQDLRLKMMLDIPQLFTAEGGIQNLDLKEIKKQFKLFEPNKKKITGIHIWGRDKRSHQGDLNHLFNKDTEFKEEFLTFLSDYLNDDTPRYLVPEVNSKREDFNSIIKDLQKHFNIT